MKQLDMVKKFFVLAVAVVAFSVPANNRLWKWISSFDQIEAPPAKPILDPKLQALADRYEGWVQAAMRAEQVPGAAVAIVKNDTVVLLKGFGVKKTGTTDSVGLQTVFRLASLSKGFAPVLTSMLVQEGKISWEDKIIDHFPALNLKTAYHTENLNIRHVLSHTTGMPRQSFSNLLNQGWYYDEILPKLKEVKLTHRLGEYYSYQNVAYSFIGDVIQSVTGRPYARMLETRIFEPAGMKYASATFDGILETPDLAYPHNILKGGGYQAMEISRNYYEVIPAAGVNASISDMVCWLQVLYGNRPDLISAAQLQEIFQPQVQVNLKEMRHWDGLQRAWYALGWRVLDFPHTTLIYHGGFVNGYRSEIAFDPQEKIGIVVLSNGISHFIGDSVQTFFDMWWNMNKTQPES